MKKKNTSQEELQKFWEDHIGNVAYDIEEAFLEVFRTYREDLQTPAFYLGSIAMAAGHIMQVVEEQVDYEHSFKDSFDDVMMQTYNHYRKHPSDAEESSNHVPLKIDLSKLS